MTNRMPELLCPAGNLESLEAALHFGADAVYGGMKQFGLRAFAGNFDEEALTQAVEKMHGAGKKFYLTMNIFPFDDQLDDFIAAAKAARDIGVDAAIVSDLGAIAALRREVPELPLHVSTQASTVNAEAVRVYRDMGCERVILARETSIARAKEIIRRVPEMEIETFVHGVQRAVPAQRGHGGAERQSGRVRPAVPLALQRGGGEAPRRVHARLRGRKWHIHIFRT